MEISSEVYEEKLGRKTVEELNKCKTSSLLQYFYNGSVIVK
jgi:hypothetical protein